MKKNKNDSVNNSKKRGPKPRKKYRSPVRDWATSKIGIETISGWALQGATNQEIADMLKVTRKSFQEWLKKYDDLRDAVSVSKEMANARVINSAFKSATGYDYQEEELDRFGEVHDLKKHQAANSTILKFWLMNRMGDKWRDKQSLEVSGKIDSRLNDIPTDELISHFKSLERSEGDQIE